MYLNLSFYFKLYAIFKAIMLSIIEQLLLPRYSLPSFSVNVISLLFLFIYTHPTSHSNLSIKLLHLVQFLSPFLIFPNHLFSTIPLSYQHTLQSILPHNFSLDVFYSLPSNYTNQITHTHHIFCRPFYSKLISYLLSPLFLLQIICNFIDSANAGSHFPLHFYFLFAHISLFQL